MDAAYLEKTVAAALVQALAATAEYQPEDRCVKTGKRRLSVFLFVMEWCCFYLCLLRGLRSRSVDFLGRYLLKYAENEEKKALVRADSGPWPCSHVQPTMAWFITCLSC